MKTRRVVSLVLVVLAFAGCANHMRPAVATAPAPAPEADDAAGAIAADLWYVPGRALVCGGSAVIAGVVMTLTLGQSYDSASQVMHGGCSGPWVVRPRDVRQAVP
jgi:hypothetical protein